MTNILEGLPTNAARYWGEYKGRVETALGRFRALGLSRYTDGRAEWAHYAGYQTAQHRKWLRYERKHYPPLSHAEGMRLLWEARANLVKCQAAGSPGGWLADATMMLQIIQYRLWNTDWIDTSTSISDGTVDLSDPFEGLRQVVESSRQALARWQEIKADNPAAIVGDWIDGHNVSVSVDDKIEDAEQSLADDEDRLHEATGEED